MIKITATLYPAGMRLGAVDIAEIVIHSTRDGKNHIWSIRDHNGDSLRDGIMPKRYSAHQNIFHALRDVLEMSALDELGKDYIPRGGHDPQNLS
jgi:hypothetical protein